MASDDPIRASDSDRDVVVAALREAYTAGRLTLEEFDERMSAAYSARTWGDLRQLTADLPSQPILGSDVPTRPLPPTAGLPSHAPRHVLPEQPPQPQHRHRPVGLLIPVAIWTLLAVHGGAGGGFVLVVIAMVMVVVLLSSMRRN